MSFPAGDRLVTSPCADWRHARGGVSDPRKQAAAYQAALRTIARGERPVYGVMKAEDGGWYVLGYP
jgi:hypothetical protein